LKYQVRLMLYRILRLCGGFKIARWLLRNNLLILCYHGISVRNEHEFYPGLFLSKETFRRRMDLLADSGFPVFCLQDALDHLKDNSLPPGAIVLTFDDGWWGTFNYAVPEMTRYNFPGTIYVTTYYVENQFPLYHIFVRYLFWQTKLDVIDLTDVDEHFDDVTNLSIPQERADAIDTLLRLGEFVNAENRDRLLSKIATAFGERYSELKKQRLFCLMTFDEIRDSLNKNIDIQLHGHRHMGNLSLNDERLFIDEIIKNREILKEHTHRDLVHFCYPSGAHHARQQSWLKAAGIESAVTTIPGVVHAKDNFYVLNRFLDSETISEIEFLAELCGIGSFLRTFFRKIFR
jgi:peptidoglycan/xylan/chitin deacetylase (PgdA/CDA1 family)